MMRYQNQKIIILASLGGMLEFFEFTIYALFSQYLSAHFFPGNSTFVSLMKTFGVYAIGYLARPLGAALFGHFGDKYGRRFAFTLTILIMSGATLLIGCLPSYQTIGGTATILLILLRILQGISVGGEIPGAAIFTAEHLPKHHRGSGIGAVFMSITFGNALGGITGLFLTHYLSENAMFAWGWRLPFIFGFALGLISYWLRKNTVETPVFNHLVQQKQIHLAPVLKVLQTSMHKIVMGFGLMALCSVTIAFFLYLPVYLSAILQQPAHDGYLLNIIDFMVLSGMTLIAGFISDKVEPKILMIAACSLVIINCFIFYIFSIENVWIITIILASLVGIGNGCYARTIMELFTPDMRYSGMGISYSLGVAIFGGLAPLIFTYVIKIFNSPTAPFFYIATCAMITLIAAIFSRSASQDIHSWEMAKCISTRAIN